MFSLVVLVALFSFLGGRYRYLAPERACEQHGIERNGNGFSGHASAASNGVQTVSSSA